MHEFKKVIDFGSWTLVNLALSCGSVIREVKSVVHSLVTQTGGPSLVFASHNLGQVKRLATRVIYMLNGRIEADLPVQAQRIDHVTSHASQHHFQRVVESFENFS